MITKKEVLNELDLIEKYKEQQMQKFISWKLIQTLEVFFFWG